MNRMLWILGVSCLGLAIPALAGPQDTGDAPSVCSEERPPMSAAGEFLWRLHAFRQIDCSIEILDNALKTQTGNAVTLSRDEAQRLRSLALGARDAAQRIGL